MNKIIYRSLLPAFSLAMAMIATSCNNDSDDDDNIFQSSMGQCLTRGEDVGSHASIFNKMSFIADYDNDSGTADVTIIGMVVPDAGNSNGIGVPRMELEDLRWSYNKQGWKVIEAVNVVPEVEGMSVVPTFDAVKFYVADVFDNNGQYKPGIQYEFELNYNGSKYRLAGNCMTGTTVVTSPEGVAYTPEADPAVAQKPIYLLDFDFENSTADLYLYNAKFLGGMPSLNLVFPKIPYSTTSGSLSFDCAVLTPMFGQTPFPSFPITNLKGTMDFMTSTLKLDFNCNYKGADYKVNIECKY